MEKIMALTKKLPIVVFFILVALFLTMFPIFAHSESYCQKVNNKGVDNAPQISKLINKMLSSKGSTYKTSAKETTNVISNYCKSNPYATEDNAITHLNNIVDIVSTLEKK